MPKKKDQEKKKKSVTKKPTPTVAATPITLQPASELFEAKNVKPLSELWESHQPEPVKESLWHRFLNWVYSLVDNAEEKG